MRLGINKRDMIARSAPIVSEPLYSKYVNPPWERRLDVLAMNVSYQRCTGVELRTARGRGILDFLSGYHVHNTGHNHPYVVRARKKDSDADLWK